MNLQELSVELKRQNDLLTDLIKSTDQWLENRKLTNNNKLLSIISEFEKIGINPTKTGVDMLLFKLSDNLKIEVSLFENTCIIDISYCFSQLIYHTSNVKIDFINNIYFLNINYQSFINLTHELDKKEGK